MTAFVVTGSRYKNRSQIKQFRETDTFRYVDNLRSLFSWDVARHRLVAHYRSFGKTCRSNLQGSKDFLTAKGHTEILSRSFGKQLPTYVRQNSRKPTIWTTSQLKLDITYIKMSMKCLFTSIVKMRDLDTVYEMEKWEWKVNNWIAMVISYCKALR